jgi:uncharacterized protein (TIGR02246 family)
MKLLPAPLILALLLAASAVTPLAHAQEPPGDESAVMEVVNRLFEGMRARNGEMVASVFDPQARMVTTGSEPDGSPRIQIQGVEGFVAAVAQGGVSWNEPLFATEVRVDGNLAHVWTFYRFYAGERFSHCGYNSIELVRTADGWRIISVADTRRTDRCDPPDSNPSAR